MDMKREVQSGVVLIQKIVGDVAHCYVIDDMTKASFTLKMDAQELLELGLKGGDRFNLRITTEIIPLPSIEVTLESNEKKFNTCLGYDDLQNDY